jgi:hypothetical protein
MDVVYSATALLESPISLTERDITDGPKNGRSVEEKELSSKDKWMENFWYAYDSLLSPDKITRGIQISIELQKAIVD